MEILVSRAAAVDVSPCDLIVEGELVRRDADHWTVGVMAGFDPERNSASDKWNYSRNLTVSFVSMLRRRTYGGNPGEQRAREAGEGMEPQVVNGSPRKPQDALSRSQQNTSFQ